MDYTIFSKSCVITIAIIDNCTICCRSICFCTIRNLSTICSCCCRLSTICYCITSSGRCIGFEARSLCNRTPLITVVLLPVPLACEFMFTRSLFKGNMKSRSFWLMVIFSPAIIVTLRLYLLWHLI